MIGCNFFCPPPPSSQNSILGKKVGDHLQIRQNFNQLGFGSNFQGNLGPIKDCDWRWKFPPPWQKLDFRQKGGHPKSGKISTNSDLAETFRVAPGLRKNGIGNEKFYPLSQNSILGKKKGGHPKSGKNSTNSDLAETFRITPGLRRNGIGNEKFYPP